MTKSKTAFEQVNWSQDKFIHNWDFYRANPQYSGGIPKGYVLIYNKTGRPCAWVLLNNKTPDQINEVHLKWGGWTAKEVTYEEIKKEE